MTHQYEPGQRVEVYQPFADDEPVWYPATISGFVEARHDRYLVLVDGAERELTVWAGWLRPLPPPPTFVAV